MKYVYMMQGEPHPDRYYVGAAVDLKRRIHAHNAGESLHTNKYKPWNLIGYVAFSDNKKADRFERYLKTGSGRAFAKRHFLMGNLMLARIFRPARTAMQSGNAAAEKWVLEYEPEVRPAADPLMGYTSSADMRRQIRLEFDTSEEAVLYAERNGIPHRVMESNASAPKKLSYSDNFRFGRPEPWTH